MFRKLVPLLFVLCVVGGGNLKGSVPLAAANSAEPPPIELVVLYSWDNVNQGENVLSMQAQRAGVETTADYLSDTLSASVGITSFTPSLGKTPEGHVNTLAVLSLGRKVGDPAGTGKRTRSLIGISEHDASSDVGPVLSTLTSDIPVRILRNQSNEGILRQLIMTNLRDSGALRTPNGQARRTLGYEGVDAPPRLRNIHIEEQRVFDKMGGSGSKTTTKTLHEQHQPPAEPQRRPDSAKKHLSRLSGVKHFTAKHFTDGLGAQDTITKSEAARYNLDIINGGDGRSDGNTAMPSLFFPPQRDAHIIIIDTVVDLNHQELIGRADMPWDGHPDEDNLGLCEVHGTHVAAIAGGSTVGANPQAKIHSFKAMNCEGFGYTSDIIGAVVAAKEFCTSVLGGKSQNGLVINLSLGGPGDPNSSDASPLFVAINQTRDACDALFVAAAGNAAGDSCMTIPAGYYGVVAVGATDSNNVLASFSNYGSCVKLNAPGVNIVSAGVSSNNAYVTLSGTSMSSPLVAGVASLHLTRRPSYWNNMFPQNLFSDNIVNKMLADSIRVVTGLPSAQATGQSTKQAIGQTTSRLLQVNSRPIASTSILAPVPPGGSSPTTPSPKSRSSGAALGWRVDLDQGVPLWWLSLTWLFMRIFYNAIVRPRV